MTLRVLPLLMCLLGCADSGPRAQAVPSRLDGWRVIDGDTLEAELLHLPYGLALTDVTLRMADYDAWESSKRRTSVKVTDEEVKRGRRATEELTALLNEHEFRVLPSDEGDARDVYGRLLVIVEVKLPEHGWQPLAKWMQLHGHIRQ